jgi:hypothetical protein
LNFLARLLSEGISFLHGAHHVAQKLIIIGFPSLLNSEVFTLPPSMSVTFTDGIVRFSFCEKINELKRLKIDNKMIFFI